MVKCKKHSTTLLYNSIKNKSTQCNFKKKFVIYNHEKTLDYYRAQNVSPEWCSFHLLEIFRHSTPSFLCEEDDFLESWWNLSILFKKPSTSTVENEHLLGQSHMRLVSQGYHSCEYREIE